MTVEQLWTHADLGPMPTLTQRKWLLFPPVPIETLERLSQLTHVSVDRLRAMQAPIGWCCRKPLKSLGRFLPGPRHTSLANPWKLPLSEFVEFLVQEGDAHLHDTVCSRTTPTHMLAFTHPTANDSIDR